MRHDARGRELRAFAVDGARQANYFQTLEVGRVVSLGFDTNGDGQPDETLDRAVDNRDWPHCILVLDGAAFDVVDRLWRDGHFRLFPRPTRVVSVFPGMTDLALTRLFHTPDCIGPEALYFDKSQNRMVGGSLEYLRGDNAPWLTFVSYHAPQDIGAKAYLDPPTVFNEELRGAYNAFRGATRGTVSAYSIGAAGLGTRGGPDAIREYMLTVEQLVERVVYEKRGRVRFTLTADHGHNLRPCRRVNFESTLSAAGLRRADQLNDDRDVVLPAYGLVTYAAAFTRQPRHVAEVLVRDPAVELAAFVDGVEVVVLSRDGEARIMKQERGHTYVQVRGDPLRLAPIVARMKKPCEVNEYGVIDDRALFLATAEHDYPDPLHRLWQCFHGLMKQPPDVALSLRDDACHGSWLFELGIGRVASTHGSLNLKNSSAFLLSDVGELPRVVRIEDALGAVERARRATLERIAAHIDPRPLATY